MGARVRACVCARRGRARRAAGRQMRPGAEPRSEAWWGTVRPGDPPREARGRRRRSRSCRPRCGLHPAGTLHVAAAAAACKEGRPPARSCRSSFCCSRRPRGLQRSATSFARCGTTPPPGRGGCGVSRDSRPSLASPAFHQACTFSLRVSRYLRP